MFEPKATAVIDGKYELIEEIGRGGMGWVWRAHMRTLDIPCAIKFIKEAYANEPTIRTRFLREARAAAKLQSPNTVSILDVGEWQDTPFMAMELLRGETLEQRLAREKVLDPRSTCDIIDQVARGLHKAHQAWLVHRDLKPENVFLVDETPLLVKILDFGIAKQVGGTTDLKTVTGMVVGTPHYMSPEQAAGDKAVDYRSDLWSLAVVAFQCLTGRRPFEGTGLGDLFAKILTGKIPTPRSVQPGLPEAVDRWWNEVASRDPTQRPESALAVAQGLREALGFTSGMLERSGVASTVAVGPVQAISGSGTLKPVSRRPTGARGQRWLPAALAIAVCLLAVGIVGYSMFDQASEAPELSGEAEPAFDEASSGPDVGPAIQPVIIDSPPSHDDLLNDEPGASTSAEQHGDAPAAAPSASSEAARSNPGGGNEPASQPPASSQPASSQPTGTPRPKRHTPKPAGTSTPPKKKTLDERLGF